MFTELFGGGKANLILTDESDPLESGIDIIAKPPGKQLTEHHPALRRREDDDRRRAALLHLHGQAVARSACSTKWTRRSTNRTSTASSRSSTASSASRQFVVITHNKRTIARADALYGVTMEEHGVSKLVGVKFSTRERVATKSDDVLGTQQSRRPCPASPRPSARAATCTARTSSPPTARHKPRTHLPQQGAARRPQDGAPFLRWYGQGTGARTPSRPCRRARTDNPLETVCVQSGGIERPQAQVEFTQAPRKWRHPRIGLLERREFDGGMNTGLHRRIDENAGLAPSISSRTAPSSCTTIGLSPSVPMTKRPVSLSSNSPHSTER